MKLKTKIENMICFIDLKQQLFLDDETAQENGFQPLSNLSGYSFFPEGSRANFLVFPSGKIFLNGITSQQDLERSFWLLFKKLKNTCLNVELKPDTVMEVQNIMVSANLRDFFTEQQDFSINLERLAQEENADYDPKKFPAVFLKFFSGPQGIGKVPLLGMAIVFRSGKILVGDVKSVEDANIILERVIEKVK